MILDVPSRKKKKMSKKMTFYSRNLPTLSPPFLKEN